MNKILQEESFGINSVNSKKTPKIMYNNPIEIKTETTTSVLCDADVGVHREGFMVPNVLSSDLNLFVHTHRY